MALQLTIIKFPPGVSLNEDRKTVSAKGARIGRGSDNDWVLTDPERFLSSKHCQVSPEGERFFLTDLSTNGTFVNGSAEPLGRGKRVALNDGDSFDVGDYRFKVSLVREANPFPDDPFKDSPSRLANKSSGFGLSKDAPNDVFMSNAYGGELSDVTPDELKVTDPLQALDNAQRSSRTVEQPIGGDIQVPSQSPAAGSLLPDDDFDLIGSGEPRGSQEDSGNRLQDAADWPVAKAESGLLPDDWDADISLLHSGKRAPKKDNAEAPERRQPRPAEGGASNKGYLPADDSLIVKRQPAARNPRNLANKDSSPAPARPTNARAEKPAPKASKPSVAKQAKEGLRPNPSTNRTRPANGSSGRADRSLVDAMGLQDVDLSDGQVQEINATVGAMMRESLDGLMQILRSRASIKNEFRINITTIQPVENNPIKFSANVDEILELMFVRRSKAYKEPLEAVQESFNTIADHQLAVIAGIRSAFRSALGKFDPLILQEEFKTLGKAGVLPGIFKGGMWNAYQEYYQNVVNDMERSFQELFGDEFVQAYEEQLRKLAHARKRDV